MPLADALLSGSGAGSEILSSVVFERTDLGIAAIKSSASDIPRRLRTLMLVVDGRSDVSQYEPFLSSLGPLPEKFAELERLGYLRRKGGERVQSTKITDVISRPVAPPVASALSLPVALPGLPRAAAPSPIAAPTSSITEAELLNFALDSSALTGPNFGSSGSNFAPDLQALASHLNKDPQAKLSAPDAATTGAGAGSSLFTRSFATDVPTLQDLLGEMENFLSSVAGLDGLPLALMFGQITSLAQLRRELPAYLTLLQPYGAVADAHVQRLSGLLDRAQV